MDAITYDDFAKVDVRVGRIVAVDDFPQAASRPGDCASILERWE